MGAKLIGLEEFQAKLKAKVSKKVQEEILENVGSLMVDRVTQRMAKNEIKPKTKEKTLDARRKRKDKRESTKFPKGITLIDTGALIGSIRHKIYMRKKKVLIGTNLDYAKIHQYGGRTGRGKKTKLPARPYLFFTFVDKALIQKIVKKIISRA